MPLQEQLQEQLVQHKLPPNDGDPVSSTPLPTPPMIFSQLGAGKFTINEWMYSSSTPEDERMDGFTTTENSGNRLPVNDIKYMFCVFSLLEALI